MSRQHEGQRSRRTIERYQPAQTGIAQQPSPRTNLRRISPRNPPGRSPTPLPSITTPRHTGPQRHESHHRQDNSCPFHKTFQENFHLRDSRIRTNNDKEKKLHARQREPSFGSCGRRQLRCTIKPKPLTRARLRLPACTNCPNLVRAKCSFPLGRRLTRIAPVG